MLLEMIGFFNSNIHTYTECRFVGFRLFDVPTADLYAAADGQLDTYVIITGLRNNVLYIVYAVRTYSVCKMLKRETIEMLVH